MKKLYYAMAVCLIALSGCSDRGSFLLQCNTKGFLNYRGLNHRECSCVADKLQSSLTVEEYDKLNIDINEGNDIPINSPADIAMREAARLCINELKL